MSSMAARSAAELRTRCRTLQIRPRLRAVAGVAEVNAWGGAEARVRGAWWTPIALQRRDRSRPESGRSWPTRTSQRLAGGRARGRRRRAAPVTGGGPGDLDIAALEAAGGSGGARACRCGSAERGRAPSRARQMRRGAVTAERARRGRARAWASPCSSASQRRRGDAAAGRPGSSRDREDAAAWRDRDAGVRAHHPRRPRCWRYGAARASSKVRAAGDRGAVRVPRQPAGGAARRAGHPAVDAGGRRTGMLKRRGGRER
jgi:hypothetical protein